MLAKAFDRKLRAKYLAEGKAEGEARTLSAIEQAAKHQGADVDEIQRVIEEARKIVRKRTQLVPLQQGLRTKILDAPYRPRHRDWRDETRPPRDGPTQ